MSHELALKNLKRMQAAGINWQQLPDIKNSYYLLYDSVYDFITQIDELRSEGFFGEYIQRIYDVPLTDEFQGATHSVYKDVHQFKEEIKFGRIPDFMIDKFHQMREEFFDSEKIRNLVFLAESKKRKRVFKEAGSELDIDKFIGGQENCWQSMVHGLRNPVCKLSYNSQCLYGETVEDQMTKAIQCLTVADCLTKAGVNTEIWANDYLTPFYTDLKCSIGVRLKAVDEQLDWQRVLCASMDIFHIRIMNHIKYYFHYGLLKGKKEFARKDGTIGTFYEYDYREIFKDDERTLVAYGNSYSTRWHKQFKYDIFLDDERSAVSKIETFLNR